MSLAVGAFRGTIKIWRTDVVVRLPIHKRRFISNAFKVKMVTYLLHLITTGSRAFWWDESLLRHAICLMELWLGSVSIQIKWLDRSVSF